MTLSYACSQVQPLARFFSTIALACLCFFTPARGEETALKLGVLPNVSTRVLFANYQPLRAHLEAALSQPVQVVTAGDFRGFHAATLAREYDVVVTAANLARIAELDKTWLPLAVFEPGILGVLVRSKANPPAGVAALKSKRLALSNPQSLVALRGFEWLAERGLKLGVDYTTVVLRNDDSLYMALGDGSIPYAIMSMGEFRAMPEAARDKLEVETEFARVVGFVVMAAPDAPNLPADRLAKLRAALHSFMATPGGASFTELTGVRAIRPLQARELASVDAYLEATRAGLAK